VRRRHSFYAAALAALLLAPAALAQGTSVSGYSGVAGQAQSGLGSGGTLGSTQTQGTLPFTGLDLALLVTGAIVLLIVGASVRRVTRSRA